MAVVRSDSQEFLNLRNRIVGCIAALAGLLHTTTFSHRTIKSMHSKVRIKLAITKKIYKILLSTNVNVIYINAGY